MKVSDKIIIAVATYYFNRASQYKTLRVEGSDIQVVVLDPERERWDKEADLKRIDDLAKAKGWRWAAMAGTFVFTDKHGVSITMDESNYLSGGKKKRPARKSRKPQIQHNAALHKIGTVGLPNLHR